MLNTTETEAQHNYWDAVQKIISTCLILCGLTFNILLLLTTRISLKKDSNSHSTGAMPYIKSLATNNVLTASTILTTVVSSAIQDGDFHIENLELLCYLDQVLKSVLLSCFNVMLLHLITIAMDQYFSISSTRKRGCLRITESCRICVISTIWCMAPLLGFTDFLAACFGNTQKSDLELSNPALAACVVWEAMTPIPQCISVVLSIACIVITISIYVFFYKQLIYHSVKNIKNKHRACKNVVTMSLVMVSCFLSWYPWFVFQVLITFQLLVLQNEVRYSNLFILFVSINTVANPLIHFFRNREISSDLRRLCKYTKPEMSAGVTYKRKVLLSYIDCQQIKGSDFYC